MASLRRALPRSRPPEASENDPDGLPDPTPLPPPRSPLVCIPDPSQSPRKDPIVELIVPKVDHSQLWTKGAGGTPRSAQSTPTRGPSRVNYGNVGLGSGNGGRLPMHGGGRERGSSSKAVRAMADVRSCPSAEPEVRHFELDEDPSFWNDHNVQVLIRIRPINSAESALQGQGRCLRQESAQTLTWTGHPETRFTFDHIVCDTISQAKLFKVVGVPMVENCMSGYNSCMFAYGQTGSGKTHTMMGEIREMDDNPCEDRGMTPRIFEYLFARIREEEENRKNENLKYSCKCSYLEIYNEQITDLLEPSSTNLQLREDVKKGVYVENLKEHDVDTVKDVIELLLQGTANRKMAATSMNNESSRSHSVFTCNIESQWEKDSTRHIRFGRLNLVDLAGSERQKSSGAEGERLKEAANINRSLSTLGLVIMTLVDIANGRHRHVPYRDSRLTFLLQDSLGGNSKTTIIANVSPSICSANETLSALKFAQRAKLIQNNAKVNEDASGDVMALQLEIQRLKDQLNIATKHQNIPGLLFSPPLIYETANVGNILDKSGCSAGDPTTSLECSSVLDHKMPFLKSALASSLRREKMAEAQIRSLEAENEHMKQLVLQMEADIQRTKMMLHLRDETIRSLELQADDLLSGDEYLMEKNNTLTEEIQLLQEKIDKNPELTRIALENIKLLQQLKVLQDFHEKGEREILLNEISQLRNELLNVLKGKCEQARLTCRREIQVDVALHEDATPCIQERNQHRQKLTDCSDKCMGSLQTNDCFTREVNDLHCPPKLPPPSHQSVDRSVIYCLQRESQMMPEAGPLPVALTLVNNVLGDRIESLVMSDEVTRQQEAAEVSECGDTRKSSLQATLGKTQGEPQAARSLYMQFQNEHYSHLSQFYEMEKIREQVEVETAQTILNLQQELAVLQQELCSRCVNDLMDETPSMILRTENEELKERLLQVTDKNVELLDLITAKDAQINVMTDEWERAVIDLTSFLLDGCQSLEDASDHIYSIIDSFPQSNSWIGDHVERAIKIFIEKERLIVNLQKSLEDAQKVSLEMASKLNSVKVATLAITEVQQIDHDETTNELLYLQMLLNEKTSMIQELENTIKCKDDQIIKAEKQSNAAFIAIKRLNEITLHRPLHARADMLMIKRTEIDHPQLPSNRSKYCQPRRSELPAPPADHWKEQIEARVPTSKLLSSVEQHRPIISEETKLKEDASVLEEIQVHIEAAMRQILESENELVACCRDTQNYLASLVSDTDDMHSSTKSFLQQMIAEIHYMKYFIEVIEREVHFPLSTVESAVSEAQWAKPRGPCLMMQLIQNDLTKTNERLRTLKADIERLFSICRYILKHENLAKMSSIHMPSGEDNLILSESDILHLRDGLKFSFDSLAAAHDQLTVLVDAIGGTNISSAGNYSYEVVEVGTNDLSLNAFSQMETQVLCYMLQDLERRIMKSDANCTRSREVLQKLNDGRWVANEKTKQAASLFLKFEEAQETMKEADLILNELIRANETAKLETERWKQTSHVMQKERVSLAAEVEQMRNAIIVDEEQNQMLKGEVNATITEMPKLLSELEEMFQVMQNHTKSELKAIHSDIFSFASEMRECIRVSKAWFETLFSEIIWENFPSCMLQQHHVVHEVTSFNLGTNPVRSLDVDSSSIHRHTEKYFPHVINSLRFSDEVTKVRNGRDEECELSDLGGAQKALNTFQNSLADIVSNADCGNFEKLDALCAPNDVPFQIAKLEKEKMDLIKDMNLVKGAISNKVMLLDQFIGFIKKQSLQHQSYECTDLHFGNECTTVNILVDQSQGCDTSILSGSSNSVMCMHPKLQWGTIYESRSVANDDDAPRQDDMEGATIDIHNLLNSIQQLRAQCAKLMQETKNKKTSQLTFLGNKIAMLRSAVTTDDTNTELGNQLMQAVDELGNNLVWLSRWLCADLDAEIEMDIFPSFLEMFFQGLCNFEEKTCKFIGRQSINVIEQDGNLASSLSPKTESDQKDALFRCVHSGQVHKESISTDKDIKYEEEEKTDALSNVQNELAIKITQVDAILQHQKELDSQLADSEAALSTLRSELEDTKDALAIFVKDNKKLVLLLEDINRQKMDAEEQLRDQEKVIHNLEREILHLNASIEERIFSSVEEIIEELRLVTDERDQLQKEFIHLNEKLDMASALADENEAIAIEARQDAEASKVYAEEREEEVKVLESSVEELEGTINVLEKKVYDMGEEVERYRLIRENLEQELQTLRGSVFIRAPASENSEIEDCIVGLQQMPRQIDDILMDLSVSKKCIKDLEKERAFQAEEIKRYKEHISEIVLHSEAQSSLYQQKFQALEAMVYEAKTNPLVSNHTSIVTNKIDKTSMRQRGSGSPFRCISTLVQQMSSEKDQELSVAKHRIEELEVLASDRQKQVCMLSARLAAVDNMTHDVIRDLLEVKLDMTNYANQIDWKELQKLLENGWQENDQSSTKDDEILRLKVQINALIEEKDSWIEQRKAEILATQEKLEKLLHRDQLLTAQNEMLKLDKVNLTKKLNELDEMIKKLVGSQSIQELIQLHNVKESNASRHNKELARRLAESDKLLQRAKNELAWSPTCDSSEPFYQHQ